MNITVVTLEPMQMQIINDEPDTESLQVNIPGIRNLRSKNVQVNEKHSTRFLQEVTEEQKQNSPETDPNDTKHMQALNKILEFYSFIGRMLGMKMEFQWNWNRRSNFWILFFLVAFTWICVLYTIYAHYVNEQFVRLLEPLVATGLIIGATQKVYVWIKYYDDMVALTLNLKFVCRRTEEGCSRANVLESGFNKTFKLLKALTLGVIFGAVLYIVIPVIVYSIDKQLLSLVPIEIVFCDQSTTLGFFVANVIIAIMTIYSVNAIIMFGITFITTIGSYNLAVDLIAEDFHDLDKMWTGAVNSSVADRHAFLRNICRKRQDMNRFLNWIKKIYETKIFYYFCANYFSQIICLYQITINGWQGGYGAFFTLVVDMLFYCYMGASISISDDRICSIIYDTRWYEYDLISQEIILLLLKEAQMNRDLQMGFIGPLNMLTFITIYKSIYSYYTILTEML